MKLLGINKQVWVRLLFILILSVTIVACGGEEFDDEEGEAFDAGLVDEEAEFDEEDAEGEETVVNSGNESADDEEEMAEDEGEMGEGTHQSADVAMLADGMQAYIEEQMDENQIPGVSYAIVYQGEVAVSDGFGVRSLDTDEPVDADTLFHIGSTQKSMTAMLIGSLVSDGVLEWDTPVVEVYPAFSFGDNTESVTVRHLLGMSGGIDEDDEGGFDLENGSGADVVTYIAELEPIGAPDEEFSYSNLSSALVGYTAVMANGGANGDMVDAYNNLLRARVLDPIGMERTTPSVSTARADANHAVSHVLDGDSMVVADSYDFDGDPLTPSGNLKSSANEMALYILTQLNQGTAPNGTQIVDAEVAQEMWEPNTEIGEGTYALGWEVIEYEGVTVITHGGAYDNFMSVLAFIPDLEVGLVILVNTEEGEELVDEAPYVLVDLLLE
ncbi:MAG TPA: serine hydrolase domain-containing protein [Anaerolineae bacterium]|nr:serine hydrolase domain-containing protein [Anaerolineae bacterium]